MNFIRLLSACLLLLFAAPAVSQDSDDDYRDIPTDLREGFELAEVAERAHDNRSEYFEEESLHQRTDGHDHVTTEPFGEEVEEEELSAYDAVGEIWLNASSGLDPADKETLDVLKVVVAVVDAWTECSDTYGAVQRGVELAPDRAAEIAATIAAKKDCNCAAGGIWPTERIESRIRVQYQHPFINVPKACSCSQAAMFGAISGLPENPEYLATAPEDEQRLLELQRSMVEKTSEILERTHAMQNQSGWDCGCTDANLAATMRGIESSELRERTWEGLAEKYVEEAGDTGLVVDAFGTVGNHPVSAWGSTEVNSETHSLRRKAVIYRGDPLLMDPFDPSEQWQAHDESDFSHVMQHRHESDFIPTDIFMSEYVEGPNQRAAGQPEEERDPADRNRVLELYNGSDRTIDLGDDQYILEIYGPGSEAVEVPAPPPALVTNTISLDSGVTFELDKAEIRPVAGDTLKSIVKVLNEVDIFSELLIVGHTCDLAPDDYNQRLSERRAQAVRDYLLESGLQVDAVRIEGRGESEPVLPNTSEANRSQNRRVEIQFVTRDGIEINRTVSGGGGDRTIEYTWTTPGLAPDPVPRTVRKLQFGDEHFVAGDTSPRQVIGLNGAIEPGQTLVIAHDNSDDHLLDRAHIVTGQLDYTPSDTLVIRRFGGDRALTCHAHTMTMLTTYDHPAPLLIGTNQTLYSPGCSDPTSCSSDDVEIASPN